jgi:hypothetical protein
MSRSLLDGIHVAVFKPLGSQQVRAKVKEISG